MICYAGYYCSFIENQPVDELFFQVFVWRKGNMECALQAVFIQYNRSRDIWCLTKDICRMGVVDGLFSYAEDMPVERSFIRQSNDSKSLKKHIHAYNKNNCVNSRA